MHRRAIFAIARKDALDAVINRSTLLVLLSPLIIAVVFAIFTQIFADRPTRLLIYNPSGSAIEEVVTSAFTKSQVARANSPDDVAATFGSDGAQKSSDYAAGLVVPADFDASLREDGHPQVQLYVNGGAIGAQQQQLLAQALAEYSRAIASPTPPATISVSTINPPSPSAMPDLSKFYAMAALLASFIVGTSLMPGLLIEEKEKKTLRMLMVSSASWSDIVAGKLLVGLGYQFLLAVVALAVTRGFIGQAPLLLIFTLLGSLFSLTLGLLFGSIFKTTSAASATSVVTLLYILPVIFVGPVSQVLGNNVFSQAMRFVPTYYLAEGVVNALQGTTTTVQVTTDIVIMLGATVALFVAAIWTLRRQASVVGAL